MTVHKSASLPLRARIKSTLNLRAAVRGATLAQNLTAKRVVDHLHDQILQSPEKSQRYNFDDIGAALGVNPAKVRLSLAEAGLAWVSVEVSAKDRAAIRKLAKKRSR